MCDVVSVAAIVAGADNDVCCYRDVACVAAVPADVAVVSVVLPLLPLWF